MAKSHGKTILKWTVLVAPWLLAAVLAAGWWLTVWTPGYLERLVPRLAADMGLRLTEFHVRSAGLFSADIGPVRLGDGADALTLANVHVSYTPASLRAGRVDAVRLDGLHLACSYDGERFRLPVLDMLPASGGGEGTAEGSTVPMPPLSRLTLRGAVLDCEIMGRTVSVPVNAEISPGEAVSFIAELTPRDQIVRVEGTLSPTLDDLSFTVTADALRVGAFSDFLPVPLEGTAAVAATGKVNLADPANAMADFSLALSGCDLRALGVELAEGAVVGIKGRFEEREIRFSMDRVELAEPYPASLDIPAGRLGGNELSAQFSVAGAGVEMGGRFDAARREDGGLWDVSFTAANPDKLTVRAAGRTLRLNGFIFSLHGTANAESADVVLNCGTRGTGLAGSGFSSGPMRLTLPLQWPAPKANRQGDIRVSGLRLDQRKLGNVRARVRQEGTDLAFGGTLHTELLPGLRVPFSGRSSMVRNESDVSFKVAGYALPEGFDPATLAPALKGVGLTGTLRADGGVTVDERGVNSRLGVFLTHGRLTMNEGSTVVDGIDLAYYTPDLLTLRSAPAQTLSFDSLTAGDIALTKGRVVYQLESMGSILVEQAGFDWCGGHVSSRAFRIEPESNEYAVTLFCSELKLSEILEQLGLAKAEGEAALSGELPVTWKDGKISFNSGFLHSTPGEGGTIRVEAMQDLVDSIPEGTPERGQLELAREAVRDFNYKWVRIKADTVGEDLLVRLSLDGKPASTLPFVYKREFGGFIRVTGDVKGSNFQGLRLDVNFSVPLDRILLYKDITRMIE
ncbi:Dicarboxylate transport [Pseudodesulfovibrio hydrargyri]|uniref:Dicarboxylate transport n=1 Tax=Pseudodesulfovibrio hydrargyri TaxID=2125990 RepID=A0A1J5MVB7_9BACT|nr:YdbH domain-containing protein [Pseudodesulfovibrio hydrargyri]OIQ50542.1 Dicarboxylate transport [Pseudodesulfovibrio hydrargyri]